MTHEQLSTTSTAQLSTPLLSTRLSNYNQICLFYLHVNVFLLDPLDCGGHTLPSNQYVVDRTCVVLKYPVHVKMVFYNGDVNCSQRLT